MKVPLLIKKSVIAADERLQIALKNLMHPDDCVSDLQMWVESKANGETCEVSDDEAILFMAQIASKFEVVDRCINQSSEWLKAICND